MFQNKYINKRTIILKYENKKSVISISMSDNRIENKFENIEYIKTYRRQDLSCSSQDQRICDMTVTVY